MSIADAERNLLRLGAVLVLLAMLTGLLVGPFPKVGLILAAHLAATMSGTLMVAVGAGVHKLTLTDGARTWLVRTMAGSGYLNWIATLLGAALGTHWLTPVNGAGTAGPAAEVVVGALLAAMVVCTFASLGIVVKGTAARS
jgi:hypothetical protein